MALVFASGFLSPGGQDVEIPKGYEFGLYAALADGTVIQLPAISIANVEDKSSDQSLLLYPHPANEYITIDTGGAVIDWVNLYTVDGTLIKSLNRIEDSTFKFDLRDVATGAYLLKINTNSGLVDWPLLKY